VDLAYATTGHRAQGLTRGRALVRLTGSEDVNWLYVQLSRARQDTRLYAVVGPEPQGAGELDLPDRDQPDACLQLAHALSRAGGQTLAIDTPSSLDLGRLSTSELRAERDRLRRQLDQAPRDRARELARATVHREQAEAALATHQQAGGGQRGGMLRWLPRDGEQPAEIPGGLAVATQQANRTYDQERELRQHQQHRAGWLEANAHLGPAYRDIVRTLAWQRRATGGQLKLTGLAMSWRPSARFRRRPGAGGPGVKPRPRSSSTGAATRSLIRSGRSVPSPTIPANEPHGSGLAAPSSGFKPSSTPPTAPTTANPPARTPANREPASSKAVEAPSGPPASTTRKEHNAVACGLRTIVS
jgi:hypothetical protein